MALYILDHSGTTAATQPTGTTRRGGNPTEATWTYEYGGILHGGNSNTERARFLTFDAIDADANRANVEILLQADFWLVGNVGNGHSNRRGIGALVRGSGTTVGYRFQHDGENLRIYYQNGLTHSQATSLASVALAATQWDVWAYRFRVNGTALKLKAWLVADMDDPSANEPASWTLETTHATVSAAGWTGIGINHSNPGIYFADYYKISIATGGDTALWEPAAAATAPVVTITAPAHNQTVDLGTVTTATATATDAEDGDLTASIQWSSSLDGALGTGGSVSLTGLSIGVHTISASVTDSDSDTDTDTIIRTVEAAAADIRYTALSGVTWANSVVRNAVLGTPIVSGGGFIYAAYPVVVSTVAYTGIVKLNAVTHALIDSVLVGAGIPHDANEGHRAVGIGLSSAGTILVHPHGHQQPWSGMHSTTPHDLSTLTATATPAGTTTQSSYRRFWHNPHNGDTWLSLRGNQNSNAAAVYKWDETSKTWARKILSTGGSSNKWGYAGHLAFAPNGMIYCSIEFDSTTEFRRNSGLIRSIDGGETWTDLDGALIPGSGTEVNHPDNISVAFPSSTATNNTRFARVAIGPDNQPILFARFSGADGTGTERLWQALWNPTTSTFATREVVPGLSLSSNANAWDDGAGTVYITGAVASSSTSVLRSTNGGYKWEYLTLKSGVSFWEAYPDYRSLHEDGTLRFTPVYSATEFGGPAEVWEVPAADVVDADVWTTIYETTPPAPVVTPPISVGGEEVAAVYLGGVVVSRIYKGSIIVFGEAP